LWKRWVLFGIGLPMALLANIVRVFAILGVAYWIDKDLAVKAFHDWSSPVLFLLNTMGLMAIRNILMREPRFAPALAGADGDAARPLEEDDAF
jgi:exosortase/archaeosortase family protein